MEIHISTEIGFHGCSYFFLNRTNIGPCCHIYQQQHHHQHHHFHCKILQICVGCKIHVVQYLVVKSCLNLFLLIPSSWPSYATIWSQSVGVLLVPPHPNFALPVNIAVQTCSVSWSNCGMVRKMSVHNTRMISSIPRSIYKLPIHATVDETLFFTDCIILYCHDVWLRILHTRIEIGFWISIFQHCQYHCIPKKTCQMEPCSVIQLRIFCDYQSCLEAKKWWLLRLQNTCGIIVFDTTYWICSPPKKSGLNCTSYACAALDDCTTVKYMYDPWWSTVCSAIWPLSCCQLKPHFGIPQFLWMRLVQRRWKNQSPKRSFLADSSLFVSSSPMETQWVVAWTWWWLMVVDGGWIKDN